MYDLAGTRMNTDWARIFYFYFVSVGESNMAIDENNEKISAPRWMGIDFIEKTQMTRFALKSENLEKDSAILKKYAAEMGEISGGARKTTSLFNELDVDLNVIEGEKATIIAEINTPKGVFKL